MAQLQRASQRLSLALSGSLASGTEPLARGAAAWARGRCVSQATPRIVSIASALRSWSKIGRSIGCACRSGGLASTSSTGKGPDGAASSSTAPPLGSALHHAHGLAAAPCIAAPTLPQRPLLQLWAPLSQHLPPMLQHQHQHQQHPFSVLGALRHSSNLSRIRVFKSAGINETIMPNTTTLKYGLYGIRAMTPCRAAANTIEAVRRSVSTLCIGLGRQSAMSALSMVLGPEIPRSHSQPPQYHTSCQSTHTTVTTGP